MNYIAKMGNSGRIVYGSHIANFISGIPYDVLVNSSDANTINLPHDIRDYTLILCENFYRGSSSSGYNATSIYLMNEISYPKFINNAMQFITDTNDYDTAYHRVYRLTSPTTLTKTASGGNSSTLYMVGIK